MVNEVLGERNEEQEARLKQYKNVAKHEDMRRRRTECSVELRKQKRDDLMMKRRNLVEEDEDEKKEQKETEANATTAPVRMSFDEVIKMLQSGPDLQQTRDCFESVRRALSKSKNPPVDEVIQLGLLHALVQALNVEDDKVRFEAAWAITNVVSGSSEQTLEAVKAGATQPLVALTMSPDQALAEQALWAVANIAGDSAQLRDYVIQCQGVDALMALAERVDGMEDSFVRTLAWAFSNMCRHKNPHAPLEVLAVLSRGLALLIRHQDKTVRQDACWAISYLTDGPDEQITLAKDSGVMETIVKFLGDADTLVAPALRVLGNMATGNDVLTQTVIDLGTLDLMAAVSKRAKSSSIVKECCWLISNVIAGTQAQIQRVIDAGLLRMLIGVLESGDYKCQFECSWALANLVQGGTANQLLELYREQPMTAIYHGLQHTNPDMQTNILEVLYALLNAVSSSAPEHLDSMKEAVEETGALDTLERLQESQSEKVYSMAYKVISEFFSEDDEEDGGDENAQPIGGYNF